jgi:hypothetical protein
VPAGPAPTTASAADIVARFGMLGLVAAATADLSLDAYSVRPVAG